MTFFKMIGILAQRKTFLWNKLRDCSMIEAASFLRGEGAKDGSVEC
ncbi:MAG: hypothetical protein LBJ38_03840 [Oscillospiraceae bacterium]|nr:hypothetical protein [Oscillospiraceae bacterium]